MVRKVITLCENSNFSVFTKSIKDVYEVVSLFPNNENVFTSNDLCIQIFQFLISHISDFSKTEKKWKPVVIPMTACGIFIAAVFSFLLVENISFLFPSFVLFTLFRNFLFSIGVAFVNEA